MKRVIFLVVACTTFFLLSFTCLNIYDYITTQGHCSISFPGIPEESTDTSRSENGTPFKIHLVTYAPTDNDVFMLGWIDMNSFYPENKTLRTMLEDSRDGATKSLGATEVNTTQINLINEPFIEFTFKGPNIIGKDRIYLINKFQYSLITLFVNATTIPASSEKFIQSFKHLK